MTSPRFTLPKKVTSRFIVTLKVLQGVQGPNAGFSIKRAINVLEFFDAFPDEDEGE